MLTGDARRPRATAVAVASGRIVAFDDEALDRRSAATEVVDLADRSLVPGFRDGHLHPLWGGTELLGCDVVDAVDVADVQARVARHVTAHPGSGWVVGAGYPPEILPGGIGEVRLLDAVAPDRPVALWASDHHTLWVNSAALAACAIDASTPDPPLGTIARDGDGRPVGTLLEAATHLVERHLPTPSREDKGRGLALALERMAAAGIVWGQEAALAPDDVGVYLDLASAGRLTATVDIALRTDPLRWRDQRDDFRAARERAAGVPGVSVRTVKFFADGIIEAGTGALLEPYADDPCSCGIPNWSPDELAEAARAFDADGFGLHTHAIGDAGVRMALDAVEGCLRSAGTTARPPVVAHTQLVHPHDLGRFATLGVVANFEPLWAQQNLLMTELTEPRLGPQRSAWQYPMGAVRDTGAAVGFGSDWPVSSMVPMAGLAVAVHRQTRAAEPAGGWLPEQRLTLDQALAAYSSGTATVDPDGVGTISVGAPADLVVLEADITTVAPLDLADVAVASTWRAGEAAFRK